MVILAFEHLNWPQHFLLSIDAVQSKSDRSLKDGNDMTSTSNLFALAFES